MIQAGDFVDRALRRAFDWYAGVPCSLLAPLIQHLAADASTTYLASSNEGDAVAAAAITALMLAAICL